MGLPRPPHPRLTAPTLIPRLPAGKDGVRLREGMGVIVPSLPQGIWLSTSFFPWEPGSYLIVEVHEKENSDINE